MFVAAENWKSQDSCPLLLTWLPNPGKLLILVCSGFPIHVTGSISMDPPCRNAERLKSQRATKHNEEQHPISVTTS